MEELEQHAESLGQLLPLWSVSFFVMLLLSVAIFPLFLEEWWEKNTNKGIIAFVLSIPVIAILWRHNDFHPLYHEMQEYFAFIVLLGSLFVVSGGIFLSGDIRATPRNNLLFLAFGGVIANIFGTTGASMILIRPVLRTNRERKNIRHIPIFFIFIVSNIGGCLLPIGDPPLFMGFLRGVPFFWTLRLFPHWLFMMVLVLGVFYLTDRYFYSRETEEAKREDDIMVEPLGLHGKLNILFIVGILAAVIWAPMPYREGIMVLMSVLSLMFTKKDIREKNEFNYAPIIEVAVLFAGIFVTMIPALLILEARGAALGVREPWQFFWVTGILSSFLDNTPTYLTYLSLAQGLAVAESLPQDVIGIPTDILVGISVGAVFMGANTYIGNGPNFMVKVICEHQGTKMPSFFGYMLWSVAILFPLFVLVTLVFF